MSYDYILKILILGDKNVGKTSICKKLISTKFSICEPTMGVDFFSGTFSICNNINLKCRFWDLSGDERFKSIIKRYYNNTALILLVFDLSKNSSFFSLKSWLTEFREFIKTPYKIILIGNKNDKKIKNVEKYSNFAKNNDLYYFETNAKYDTEINKKFLNCLEEIYTDSNFIKSCPGIKPMVKFDKNKDNCCYLL